MKFLRRKNPLLMALVLFPLLYGLCMVFASPGLTAAKWPDRLVIAAPSAGTTNYMIVVGMSEVIKKYTPIKMVQVLPLGGPTVWGPMMKKGQVDLAIHSGADAIDLFFGRGDFTKVGAVPIRTLIGGHSFPLMFHTIPDKGINAIADLKNKAVYTSMMGNPMFLRIAKAQLASGGLTLKDLKTSSTMPSVAQATNHLIEGRIDAFIYPVVSVSVHQINQAKGECRFVNLTSGQADYVAKNNPGYYKAVIPAGKYANKKEMRYAIAFQTCLHAGSTLDEEVAYELTKLLLEKQKEWVGAHPQAKDWGIDKRPVTTATEPYHPGAVKYYKEKKLWAPENASHDEAMLKQVQKR